MTTGLGNRKLWFPLQASVNLVNSLPQSFKDASTIKALKVRFKGYIANHDFFDVEELLAFAWDNLQLRWEQKLAYGVIRVYLWLGYPVYNVQM